MRISDWSSDVCSSDLACTLAQVVGRPCRSLVEVWGQFHDEGWEAVAGKAGIAKRPDAMQRVKRAIPSSYERWGRPLAEVPEAQPQADGGAKPAPGDRKSTRLNSSHYCGSRMPDSA